MALIDSSLTDLVKNINRQAQVPFSLSELVFSPVFPDGERADMVRIRLTITGVSEYRGTAVVGYHRLDLATLENLLYRVPCFYPGADSLYKILTTLANHMGIRLDESDVEDAIVIETEGSFRVQLTAKPGSYRWYGSYLLRFNDLPRLSGIIDHDHITW